MTLELMHAQETSVQNENLLCHYVATLLQAFQFCGIYESLVKICTETEETTELNKKSKGLLKKLMYFSSSLMPLVPQFPEIIKISTNFTEDDKHKRVRATQLIKELSEVSLVNPLEVKSASSEILHAG